MGQYRLYRYSSLCVKRTIYGPQVRTYFSSPCPCVPTHTYYVSEMASSSLATITVIEIYGLCLLNNVYKLSNE